MVYSISILTVRIPTIYLFNMILKREEVLFLNTTDLMLGVHEEVKEQKCEKLLLIRGHEEVKQQKCEK
ncbi:hypothetical protein SAMN02799633_00493 [Bacillus sp. UNCCL81]|nr:hypothetical protein SAMN02799633_00493 [Bacillus sp. UNCCL81]